MIAVGRLRAHFYWCSKPWLSGHNDLALQIEGTCRQLNECSCTLYHTIPTFNDPKKGASESIVEKGENAGKPTFSPFPTIFSTHQKTNFNFQLHLFCRLQLRPIETCLKFVVW